MALSTLLRLGEAAELLGGGITERALRAEVRAGRLQFVKLRGKFFTTEEHLAAMVRAATTRLPCPAPKSRHASTSGPALEPQATGSSLTERASLAQERLDLTLQELKKPSGGISLNGTSRPEPLIPSSSSSVKS
jgi:hypothetical protein